MSFGRNKLLFGGLVLIILAVVSWREKSRAAERCLGAWGRKSISYKLSFFPIIFIQGEYPLKFHFNEV